ncbi:MAG: Metal dependent phosphohydrolase [uncultured bacterium]|nr:MAG: Metal dependent phosphohydrolase [uncultured bacterium]
MNLLYAAALLHDIGKLKADKIESHTEISAKILEAEGYRALKNPVRKHFFGQLETWEEKLVFYVDKIVKHDYLVTLKERLEDVKKRYSENTAFIEKAWTYAEKMEREIFKKTGENFQNIKKNLDTYEITNHRG